MTEIVSKQAFREDIIYQLRKYKSENSVESLIMKNLYDEFGNEVATREPRQCHNGEKYVQGGDYWCVPHA